MIEIIPAIDIIDGKCVRLTKGDYDMQKVYHEDPVVVAKMFEDAGCKCLHLVDLDGARNGKPSVDVLKAIVANTDLVVDFSGGIRTEQDVMMAIEAGAAMLCIGSMSVSNTEIVLGWGEEFGKDKFIISADVLDGYIMTHGWKVRTAMKIEELIARYYNKGFKQFMCTDISKDGMLAGVNLDLYDGILKMFPGVDLIASGGVTTIDDVYAFDKIGCSGVIVGKAIYEERISMDQLKEYNGSF